MKEPSPPHRSQRGASLGPELSSESDASPDVTDRLSADGILSTQSLPDPPEPGVPLPIAEPHTEPITEPITAPELSADPSAKLSAESRHSGAGSAGVASDSLTDGNHTSTTHLSAEDEDDPLAVRKLPPGTMIHRYQITRRLGAGGMGVVYQAHDPELDRQLAIKLLHVTAHNPLAAAKARKRLHREAQALARFSHPNVVQVYNSGTWGDSVYIAMEFIEGQTLRQWLTRIPEASTLEPADGDDPVDVAAGTPSTDEILDVLVAAGEGLAAAHRKGLIHRDFKLDNVMVGDDGRVRILDFGLARTVARDRGSTALTEAGGELAAWSPIQRAGSPAHLRPPSADSHPLTHRAGSEPLDALQTSFASRYLPTNPPSLLDAPITAHGAIVGTPAFMAPEQYGGDEIDPRADQFSFCVSLYRSVYRSRPFRGRSVAELRKNILGGKLVPPPTDPNVPKWLEAIILRGLQRDRDDRYPSMDALLDDIKRHRARPSKRVLLTALLLSGALLATVAIALIVGDKDNAALCQGSSDRIDEVWNSAAQQAIERAFADSGRAHAARTNERVQQLLDDYTASWATLHTEICEATHVHKRQSAADLDLRMGCMTRGYRAMTRLVEVFSSKPDGEVVDEAIAATLKLSNLTTCTSNDALVSGTSLPSEPAERERVVELSEQLDDIQTLISIGQGPKLSDQLTALTERADTLGFAPLKARAHFLLAEVQYDTGAVKEAEENLTAAAQAAGRADDDALLARAWNKLILVVGYGQGRYSEAFALRSAAESAIEGAGDSDKLRAEMLSNIGVLQDRIGKHDEAEKLAREALELATQAFGEDMPELRVYLRRLGIVLTQQRKYQQALDYLKREVALIERHFGPDHVFLASTLVNMGRTINRERQSDEALEYLERALALQQGNHGEASRPVGLILINMGAWQGQRGRYRQAQRTFERARDNNIAVFGPQNPMVADTLRGLSETLLDQGQLDEALAAAEQARDIYEQSGGEQHPDMAKIWLLLGNIFSAKAEHDQAERYVRRALGFYEQLATSSSKQRLTSHAYIELGRVLTRAGHNQLALEQLEHGLELARNAGGPSDSEEIKALEAIVELNLRRGELDQAAQAIARIQTLRDQSLRPEHPKLAETSLDAAELALARGDVATALAGVESARAILDASRVDPLIRLRAKLLHARALSLRSRKSPQAARMFRESRAALRQLGPRGQPLLAQAKQWAK